MAHIVILFAFRLLRRTAEYDSSPHCSKNHPAYHLCGLATIAGEKYGLDQEVAVLLFVGSPGRIEPVDYPIVHHFGGLIDASNTAICQ